MLFDIGWSDLRHNVNLARWRKAQRSIGSSSDQTGTKSHGPFQRHSDSVCPTARTSENELVVAERYRSRTLSVKGSGIEANSECRKCKYEKHQSWVCKSKASVVM